MLRTQAQLHEIWQELQHARVEFEAQRDRVVPAMEEALQQTRRQGRRRTEALGDRPDVDYVLVFENRGPEVGATITHPHGQNYAFDYVPEMLDEARRRGRDR